MQAYAVWSKWHGDRHFSFVYGLHRRSVDVYRATSADEAVLQYLYSHTVDDEALMLGTTALYTRPVVACGNYTRMEFPRHWVDDSDYTFLLTDKLSPTRALDLRKRSRQ